jgi:hypothetical protein
MRVSIYEIAARLGLDAQQFRELVDEGRLDGCKLDRDCVERVRSASWFQAGFVGSKVLHTSASSPDDER